ncbi:hypothetical protein LAZ67_7000519 [Cordylochernes scorpioides]|uniref:Uncharacterized protein n=1 Tax=Cordylochernes scorpioides TaxID=51811 RepID=A0ABY6KLJ5_9ARAC|nr:hypothetical protein LAZ67_7000519 [Cordylochernes scorpioides]
MALKGRRFDTRESIITDSKKVLKNIPKDAFSKCLTEDSPWGYKTEKPMKKGSVVLAAPSLSPSFQNRVLVSVWLWVMIVLTTGFSGNMKANMMFKEPPQRLDTLEDLVAAEGVRVLVPEGSVMQATAMVGRYILDLHNIDISYYYGLSHSKILGLKSLRSEAGKKFWKKILDSDGVQDVKEVFTDDNMDQVLQLRAIMIFDPFAMIAKLVRRCSNLQSGNQFYFSKYELLSLHLMVSYNPRLDRDFVAIMDRSCCSGSMSLFYKAAAIAGHENMWSENGVGLVASRTTADGDARSNTSR